MHQLLRPPEIHGVVLVAGNSSRVPQEYPLTGRYSRHETKTEKRYKTSTRTRR